MRYDGHLLPVRLTEAPGYREYLVSLGDLVPQCVGDTVDAAPYSRGLCD